MSQCSALGSGAIQRLYQLPSFSVVPVRFHVRRNPPPGKPPHLPPSKTHRYTVAHEKWQDPDVVRELLWRRAAYNDAMHAIRLHFKHKVESHGLLSERHLITLKQREQTEFAEMLLENEAENRKVEEIRKEKDQQLFYNIEQQTEREIREYQEQSQQALNKRREEVLNTIAASENFITEENLMQKLEHALDNPVSLEYAVDKEGRKYTTPVFDKYLDASPVKSVRMYERSLYQPNVTKADSENSNTQKTANQQSDQTAATAQS